MNTRKNQIIAAIAAVVLVVILFVVTSSMQNDQSNNTTPPKTSKNGVVTTGSFTLEYDKEKNAQGVFRVGQPIALRLLADSNGAKVTDFDTYIQYNDIGFTVGTSTSLLPDYSIVKVVEDSVIAVSGYKSIKGTPMMFKNTPLYTFDVTPKKEGVYTFEIKQKSGRTSTKYITIAGEPATPATNSLRIVVVR